MSTSRPELDADALELLAAFRNEEQIPAPVHDRVWDRICSDRPAAPPATTGTQWARRGAVIGLMAAAAVAMLWIGRGTPSVPDGPVLPTQARYGHPSPTTPGSARSRSRAKAKTETAPELLEAETDDHPDPDPEPRSDPEPRPAGGAGADDSTATHPAAASRARPRSRAPRPSPARPTPPSSRVNDTAVNPDPSRPPSDTLAEENRLLTRARAELIAERPERALAVLREHARRFARGVLAEEREALHAIALCEAELNAQGVPAARSFLRAHPGAALASRVRSACLS